MNEWQTERDLTKLIGHKQTKGRRQGCVCAGTHARFLVSFFLLSFLLSLLTGVWTDRPTVRTPMVLVLELHCKQLTLMVVDVIRNVCCL